MWTKQEKNWKSVSPVLILSRDLTGSPEFSFSVDLSGVIPEDATEVSLSFYYESGDMDCDSLKEIYVRGRGAEGPTYRMIRVHLYFQPGWSYSTTTMELPAHSKTITVDGPQMCTGSRGGTTGFGLYLTGYR